MAKHIKATSGSEGNLDESVKDFNSALTGSLNAVAALQTKQITIWRRVPCFMDDARDLKKNV